MWPPEINLQIECIHNGSTGTLERLYSVLRVHGLSSYMKTFSGAVLSRKLRVIDEINVYGKVLSIEQCMQLSGYLRI